MKVIITMPAFNEENTIGLVIADIKKVMSNLKYNYKILVVDDGSKDNTAAIAKKAGAIVYSHPANYGLADTFRTEIRECLKLNPDLIVHTDADGQYLAKDIPRLLDELKKGNDLVLGSRFMGKIEKMPFVKKLGNRAFSRVISKIIKQKVIDCQTGFRAFTKEVAKLPITSNHTYTQEQIIRTAKEKMRIKEIPIFFARRKEGKSRLIKNPFEYAMRAGVNLLRIFRDYEPLKFFGIVGAILFIGGFLLGIWLLYLFLTTGIVGHIPATILSILLLISGLQIILFGFMADMKSK